MMTTKLIGVLIVCAIFCTEIAHAGSQYDVTCKDKKCGFKTSVGVGGGRSFDQVQGYCRHCSSSVTLSWKRGEDDKKPKPITEFWDSLTGETRQVYKCPKCGNPFVIISQIQELRHCPKCGKPTLKYERVLLYD